MKDEFDSLTEEYKDKVSQKLSEELENISSANYPIIDKQEQDIRKLLFEERRKSIFDFCVQEFNLDESERELPHTKESLKILIEEEEFFFTPDAPPCEYAGEGDRNYDYYLKNYVANGVTPIQQPNFQIISEALAKRDYLDFLKSRLGEITENEPQIAKVDGKLNATSTLKFNLEHTGVYHIFRQLKRLKLLDNSPEEIARFIKSNIEGFDNVNELTISTELKKNKEPSKIKNLYQIVVSEFKQRKIMFYAQESHIIEIPINE